MLFLEENIVKDDLRILFTGFVQGKMLEELYSNAYVYVLPSDVEGMPLSLLEAMSYGNCYRWFSHAWIYLEQGLIGLILTVLFFVSIALAIIKRFKMKKVYTLAAFSFIPTCIIGLLYNSALELEATYMIALVCAFPFILKKRNNEMAVKRG